MGVSFVCVSVPGNAGLMMNCEDLAFSKAKDIALSLKIHSTESGIQKLDSDDFTIMIIIPIICYLQCFSLSVIAYTHFH